MQPFRAYIFIKSIDPLFLVVRGPRDLFVPVPLLNDSTRGKGNKTNKGLSTVLPMWKYTKGMLRVKPSPSVETSIIACNAFIKGQAFAKLYNLNDNETLNEKRKQYVYLKGK